MRTMDGEQASEFYWRENLEFILGANVGREEGTSIEVGLLVSQGLTNSGRDSFRFVVAPRPS